MKIERINENQIRCYITKEDLASRHIKLSELAYGTEKARGLFREMMRYASKKYGFETEDYPLMIEAVPLSSESVILTVTKVSYPDELDSRFAYYSDSDIPDLFKSNSGFEGEQFRKDRVYNKNMQKANDILSVCSNSLCTNSDLERHFVFRCLQDVIAAAKILNNIYKATNHLYKDNHSIYHLIIQIGNHSAQEFNKICNCLSEYGSLEMDPLLKSKITEHAKLISAPHALSNLANL